MTDQPDFIQNQPVVYPVAFINALGSDAAETSGSVQSEETSTVGADPLFKDYPVKEYYCGIRKWHPKWLQVFRSSKFFTLILCLQALTEGALVSGNISSYPTVVYISNNRALTEGALVSGNV